MTSAALVDSGPLLALFDRSDAHHRRVANYLRAHAALRLVTTLAVLTETAALLASRVGRGAQLDFLEWVERGGLVVAGIEPGSLRRIIEIVRKYRDLPLDFADATLAELGERLGVDAILTVDRDFEIYRRRGKIAFTNALAQPATAQRRTRQRRRGAADA